MTVAVGRRPVGETHSTIVPSEAGGSIMQAWGRAAKTPSFKASRPKASPGATGVPGSQRLERRRHTRPKACVPTCQRHSQCSLPTPFPYLQQPERLLLADLQTGGGEESVHRQVGAWPQGVHEAW